MNYFIQFLIAMTATITFAILFSVPKQELPLCGLAGALEWVVYYAIVLKMKKKLSQNSEPYTVNVMLMKKR